MDSSQCSCRFGTVLGPFNILGILQQLLVNYSHKQAKMVDGTGMTVAAKIAEPAEASPNESVMDDEPASELKKEPTAGRDKGRARTLMEEQVVEKRGKNVDEAIKAALDELGSKSMMWWLRLSKSLPGGILGFVGKSRSGQEYLNERNREKMYTRF